MCSVALILKQMPKMSTLIWHILRKRGIKGKCVGGRIWFMFRDEILIVIQTDGDQKNPPKTSVLCSGKQEWNHFSALHTWGRCWVNILRVSMAAECCEQPGDEAATPAALNVGVYFGLCCVSGYSYKTHQILKSSQKHICTSGGAGQMFLGRQLAAAVDSNNHAVRHQSQAVLLRLSRR